jgi:hypothetical protein
MAEVGLNSECKLPGTTDREELTVLREETESGKCQRIGSAWNFWGLMEPDYSE